MTDSQRFTQVMAVVMDKDTESNWWCEKCQCSVDGIRVTYQETHENCGYPVIWKEGWSPITPEGELTYEVRKWWIKNLERPYREYLRSLELSDAIFTQEAQLSWRNLWDWMRENKDEWLYEHCPEFGNDEYCRECPRHVCNGTGKVLRWDVGEMMEVNIAEKE